MFLVRLGPEGPYPCAGTLETQIPFDYVQGRLSTPLRQLFMNGEGAMGNFSDESGKLALASRE
jgi:hypothetical protein